MVELSQSVFVSEISGLYGSLERMIAEQQQTNALLAEIVALMSKPGSVELL